MAQNTDKQRRLGTTLDALQAQFGTQVVRPLVSGNESTVAALPTDWATLDRALSIGGIPRGHLTLIEGTPTSGMGTLALHIAAQATVLAQTAVYLDLAGTFDPDYAVRCGVALERLLVIQPPSLAEAIEALLILAPVVGAALLDPRDGHEALPSAALRRLTAVLRGTSCALVVLGRGGAEAFASHAAVRLNITRERWLLRRAEVTGFRTRVHIVRSRFGPERTVSLTMRLGIGTRGAGQSGDGS